MSFPQGFRLADMDALPSDPVAAIHMWLADADEYAEKRNPNQSKQFVDIFSPVSVSHQRREPVPNNFGKIFGEF